MAALEPLSKPYQVICINSVREADRYHSSLADDCQNAPMGVVHLGNEPVQQVPANTVFVCPSFWTLISEPPVPQPPDPRICPRVLTHVNPGGYNKRLFETQATSMMIAALDVYGGKMFSSLRNRVDLNELLRLPARRAQETQESYYAFAAREFPSRLLVR